jgi:hypothetical protein
MCPAALAPPVTGEESKEHHALELFLEAAIATADKADHWYGVIWTQYLLLTVVGWVLSTFIPFGFAVALSLPDPDTQRQLNIVLLLFSAVSLCCLAVASIMRLKERAENNLRMRNRIKAAISAYRLGFVKPDELHRELTEAFRLEESETRP